MLAAREASAAADFLSSLDNGIKISFPSLDDPENGIFKLILGQDVPLFDFTAKFTFDAQENQSFPVLGILNVGFSASVNVDLNIDLGYDTHGIREFLKDGKAADLLDGFFVGTDTHFILSGSLKAFADASIVIFSAGVEGGLTIPGGNPLTIKMHNPDPNQYQADIPLTKLDTNDFFDANGELDAGLDAFVKVGLDTPFGFVGWQKDFPIANVKLIDFGSGTTKVPEGSACLPPIRRPSPPRIAMAW